MSESTNDIHEPSDCNREREREYLPLGGGNPFNPKEAMIEILEVSARVDATMKGMMNRNEVGPSFPVMAEVDADLTLLVMEIAAVHDIETPDEIKVPQGMPSRAEIEILATRLNASALGCGHDLRNGSCNYLRTESAFKQAARSLFKLASHLNYDAWYAKKYPAGKPTKPRIHLPID